MKTNLTNVIRAVEALQTSLNNIQQQLQQLQQQQNNNKTKQTTLAMQVDDSIRKDVEAFITSRNFRNHDEFDMWAKKVGASTITKLCYEYTGIEVPYRELKKIAREAYYNIQVMPK